MAKQGPHTTRKGKAPKNSTCQSRDDDHDGCFQKERSLRCAFSLFTVETCDDYGDLRGQYKCIAVRPYLETLQCYVQ